MVASALQMSGCTFVCYFSLVCIVINSVHEEKSLKNGECNIIAYFDEIREIIILSHDQKYERRNVLIFLSLADAV